jgi:hypothetical protein
MYEKKLKFNIGDLVTIRGGEYMFGYTHIQGGAVGVITELLYDTTDQSQDSYFFDYTVLIEGKEYFLFEEEITIYFDPCTACGCDPCDCNWGVE